MESKIIVKKGWPKGKKRDVASHTKANMANAREYVVKKIYKEKDALIKAQLESAKGLFFFDADKNMVFTKKPNAAVGEYLLNQLIGKPKENVEIVGEVELKLDM